MGTLSTRPCALCGEPDAPALFVAENHPIVRLERAYAYFACGGCGVHFLDGDTLPPDLYLAEKQATVEDGPEDRRYVHWDDDVAASLAARVPPRPSPRRFLDLGSGWGHMLVAATRAGYLAEGVDISPVLAEHARARSGRPVHAGSLRAQRFEDGRFHVVNAHFVLEYVRDLRETFREIARVLAPGGVLRVCSYTTDSVPARLRRARWWNYAPTRPYLFSARTISFLAHASGLSLVEDIVGGEQSLRRYLEERPRGKRSPLSVAADVARWHARRLRVAGLSLGSCRAFYLEKPAAKDTPSTRYAPPPNVVT